MSRVNQSKETKKKINIILPKDEFNRKSPKFKIVTFIILIIGSAILAWFNVDLNLKISDLENQEAVEIVVENASKIELSDNQEIKTEIETEDGEVEVYSLPVVDMVDGGEMQIEESELDLGRGEYYAYDTPQAFRDATIGKCIDLDGKWGSQCVDLANAFWKEYTNRWISTCNTGMARGIWDCKEQNAGDDFKLITDKKDLQAGDWIVFDGGTYGHIGMALGSENKGYIALLGENQGGTSCSGGGSATNIINISLKSFKGAFRPKIYDIPKVPDTGFVPKDL